MQFLIARGADMNRRPNNGNGLMHLAAAGGSEQCCQMLWKRGFDINEQNSDGNTPLSCAIHTKQVMVWTVCLSLFWCTRFKIPWVVQEFKANLFTHNISGKDREKSVSHGNCKLSNDQSFYRTVRQARCLMNREDMWALTMSSRFEWQTTISQWNARATHQSFKHQFYLTVQFHFIFMSKEGARLIMCEWDMFTGEAGKRD